MIRRIKAMFEFGKPEDTADLISFSVLRASGPGLPDIHWEEMNLEDLEKAFAYMYVAVTTAIASNSSKEVVELLLEQYDEMFEHLAASSEDFKEAVRSNRHQIVTGLTEESVLKYHKLAGLIDSES